MRVLLKLSVHNVLHWVAVVHIEGLVFILYEIPIQQENPGGMWRVIGGGYETNAQSTLSISFMKNSTFLSNKRQLPAAVDKQ
jgi:hypothetical protein